MREMFSITPSFCLLGTACGFTVGLLSLIELFFLRKLLVSVWLWEFPRAQGSPFSLLQAAASVTAALEDFVKPEHLDGENCFKCSK